MLRSVLAMNYFSIVMTVTVESVGSMFVSVRCIVQPYPCYKVKSRILFFIIEKNCHLYTSLCSIFTMLLGNGPVI
jgi:hypothetical protein